MIDASQFRTLLDADVLYRAAIRDILLQLAKDDLIEARWTARIHDEWMKALAQNRPEIEWSKIERLEQFGITAEHPDALLQSLLKEDFEAVCASIRKVRIRLKNPPYSVEAFLENLDKAGLVDTANELRRHAPRLE